MQAMSAAYQTIITPDLEYVCCDLPLPTIINVNLKYVQPIVLKLPALELGGMLSPLGGTSFGKRVV